MIDIKGWKVLIVDDEPDNLSLLEDILMFYDAAITSTRSGAEAITLLAAETYRLVLLDIQMPQISGWDVIRAYLQNPAQGTVVVAVTAHALVGDKEKVLAAGFDGYVSKPIMVETFINTIGEIVASREALNLPNLPNVLNVPNTPEIPNESTSNPTPASTSTNVTE